MESVELVVEFVRQHKEAQFFLTCLGLLAWPALGGMIAGLLVYTGGVNRPLDKTDETGMVLLLAFLWPFALCYLLLYVTYTWASTRKKD